ncbi:hypothetical protein RUA4292_00272 [Ruegeria atlantica]|uniref:Uncharacterized protein n=1 Tax=Ruegeria atlantica TaxID=81569 RepID=A0A0N7LPT4_9RHOB|nr:hypothetical protein RUA4292_00272 [Ruegeria atlantica]
MCVLTLGTGSLVPWAFGQRWRAKRRATLTELLETRFHGISGACSLVAARTALRKRNLTFMFVPAHGVGHCPFPFESQCGLPIRHR